jgi:pimeloyl-ACP methyl ester carboxylesterase
MIGSGAGHTMGRRLGAFLLVLVSVLLVAAASGVAYQWIATRRDLQANPPPGVLVDVGGHRLHVWCTGAGAPAVLLEAGLGGTSADWGFVQPEVARFTRVCSYDRAGMGYSDPGPSPRTARRIGRELVQLLEHTGSSGPIVLVGASSGGFVARLLASERPALVAGVVLVDASHEDQEIRVPGIAPLVPVLATTGVLRLLGVSFGPPAEALAPGTRHLARATRFRTAAYRTTAEEMSAMKLSAAEVRASRRLLTQPMVVITAGLGSDTVWRRLQRDQVALSRLGCQVIADRSGHAVVTGQPQLIVESIRGLVERARGQRDDVLCGESRGSAGSRGE